MTMDTNFKDMGLAPFTELLGSSASVPGGGGASALAGALGIALGSMVGELTIGKPRYKDVEAEIQELTRKAQALREKLLSLIEQDAIAFQPLSKAYSLPKDAPDRDDILEACLRRAANTPLDILHCCCDAIELLEGFARMGSKMVISDAATGAVLCQGAMYGAAINVKVNTKLMKRRDYADKIDQETDALVAEYSTRASQIYAQIYERYC